MKFYRYKQLQRCTFFGNDDLNLNDGNSVIKRHHKAQGLLLTILKY